MVQYNSMEKDPSTPDLPEGITVDDLLYFNPQHYLIDMAMKGWGVKISHGVDGNEDKVSYGLSRPVGLDFSSTSLDDLSERIGIKDKDGNILAGYSLVVGFVGDSGSLVEELRQDVNPHEDSGAVLRFNFTGFPTGKTIDVMDRLEQAFQEPSRRVKTQKLETLFSRTVFKFRQKHRA